MDIIRTMNIRKWMRSNNLVSRVYYGLQLDTLPIILGTGSYKRSCIEAITKFVGQVEGRGGCNAQLISDLRKAYLQCKASPEEYFLLDLAHADVQKRNSFVTDKFMYMTLAERVGRKKHDEEIEDKWGFYQLAKAFFKREAVRVQDVTDWEAFKAMALRVKRLIFKPNARALGSGIYAVDIITEEEARKEFNDIIVKGGTWIVEERIVQDDRMAQWNKSSVNSVRVLSFLNNDGFFIITPFLRTGRIGSVVDNAGAGGVFANIDYKTGIVESNGIDERGKYYTSHPESNIIFNGWQIPEWHELMKTVESIHKTVMPGHPYIGWDFALSKEKGWCVIEANWGQFVNQYIDKIGRKEEFLRYIKAKPYQK